MTTDPNDLRFALSPLADPVIGAIFASVKVAALSSESIINAIHKAEKESPMKGKITRITPQFSHITPTTRGCRIDVEIETDANEYYRYEIEIAPSTLIMLRALFSASHFFVEKSTRGDTAAQMATKMPKVIYINILGFNLRKDKTSKDKTNTKNASTDLVQPVKLMYTKPPQEVAIDKFSIYNIQLPRVAEMEQDFSSDLYCWCYALYTAHTEKKTVKEVIDMTPGLQAFAARDPGFQQFSERHQAVSADPKTRREYVSWFGEMLRQQGEREWIEQEYAEKLAESEKKLTEFEKKLMESEKKRVADLADAEKKRLEDLTEAEQRQKENLIRLVQKLKDQGVLNADIPDIDML